MRESQPPTPAPDVVTFDHDDYDVPVIGLCAVCLAASWSANNPIRPTYTRGVARDVEGCRVILPDGKQTDWRSGMTIPAGGDWLASLARLFGDRVMWAEGPGHPLPMLAVTIVAGTMACPLHAHGLAIDNGVSGSRKA